VLIVTDALQRASIAALARAYDQHVAQGNRAAQEDPNMNWVRHLTVALFVAGVGLAPALAQQPRGRAAQSHARPAAPQAAREPLNTPGQLGVQVATETSGLVRVEGFLAGSPAEGAGMRAGDRIVAVEGRAVNGVDQLVELVRARPAGREIKLRLRRTVALRLDDTQRTEDGRLALGLVLAGEDGGLQVSSAPPGYAAAAAGMASGDRLVELDGVELANQGQLVERMRSIGAARTIRVSFERDLRVRLGPADGVEASPPAAAPNARSRGARTPPPPRAQSTREVADEVAALRRELAALRAELAELRKLLAED
jgi:predicted metalloprotease with PDZ domain